MAWVQIYRFGINPLVPDAHYRASAKIDHFLYKFNMIRSSFKEKLRIFIFRTLGTDGLMFLKSICLSS